MWGEQIASVLKALPSLLWAGLAAYVIWLLRGQLAAALGRLSSLEMLGVKVAISPSQALSAAIDLARTNPEWQVDIPQADRQRALDRANRERALLEGAELLWVDDKPSNNRNEARMLRGFGALITFACTTEEAIRALALGVEQSIPFQLIISDMSRDVPTSDPRAGITMLSRLREAHYFQPVVFYAWRLDPVAGTPPGALGITNRPDELLHLVLDGLARVRQPR
jgi:CheY-like chemotaxis protein